MKIKVTIIVLFFLIILFSCSKEKEKYTDVYVFIDVTDSTSLQTDNYQSSIPEILKAIGIDTISGGYSGGEVKFFLIDDISNSKSEKIVIKRGNPGVLGQNPFDRMDEINNFKNGLKNQLDKILRNAEWDRNQSKIYQNICRELSSLHSAEGEKKIIIIFSDMLENSSIFSFYGSRMDKIKSYINNIEGVYDKILSKDCAIQDLSGIEIYMIAQRTVENDEKVNLAEKFWTALFEYKNADVHFDSELDIN
jgi:hypothetical protein